MTFDIFNHQEALAIDPQSVEALAQRVLRFHGVECRLVEISFVSKEQIGVLHQTLFGDPSPTDCITLPHDPITNGSSDVLGEIYICPEVAIEYAESHSLCPYKEVSLYLIHGFLHLFGYDDLEEEQESAMRAQETLLMKQAEKEDLFIKAKSDIKQNR